MRGACVAMNRDAVRSLHLAWMIFSAVILAILLSPFLLGRERLATLAPVCERKARYGLECPFCGMTTSFLNISEARFRDASHANRAGIPLYGIFISNEVGALLWMRRKRGTACK